MLLPKLYRLCNSSILAKSRATFSQRCYCTVSPLQKNERRTMDRVQNREELHDERRHKARSMMNYLLALVVFMGGGAFAFVPFFNAFCSYTEVATTDKSNEARERTKNLVPLKDVTLYINFNADKSSYLNWKFQPLQSEIAVSPGETVLAFYSAENPSDKPISGISTYNIVPYEAAKYFNKIQCFCFDEQRLNPHEQVDMPVFFFIDPEIVRDPYLYGLQKITLSYTFFEAIEGLDLPFMSSFVEDE